jgi:hypothetical protein
MAPNDPGQLLWGESETAVVESIDELDHRLAVLTEEAKKRPFMAELIATNGNSLSMGLGREETVLSWVPANNDPPYYASKGNPNAEGTIVFYYSGDWSEFPRWSAVPVPAGWATMREFFQTGERPSTVEWQEV